VPADAPPVRMAVIDHLLHADANVVDARDIPTRMMQSRAVGFREREHMMVARMRAVHERDDVTGMIGQPQAQRIGIEANRSQYIGAEEKDVRQPARAHGGNARSRRRCAFSRLLHGKGRGHCLARRRDLVGRDNLHRRSIRITEPKARGVGEAMRVGAGNVIAIESRSQCVEILGVCGKAQVFDPLRTVSAINRPPAMRMTKRMEIESPVDAAHVESERAIEIRCLLEIGHAEDEAIERMHRRRAVTAKRCGCR
jgi:hypothetical protein